MSRKTPFPSEAEQNALHMAGEEAGKGIVQMILEYEKNQNCPVKILEKR